MRCLLRFHVGLLVAAFILSMGCQVQKPLKEQKEKSLEPMGTWAVSLSPPVRDQKITVTATSAGVPVDVFVVLEGDPDKAKEQGNKALLEKKPIPGALANQSQTENATLQATIPANKGFSVVVNNPGLGKNAEVKLEVTGK